MDAEQEELPGYGGNKILVIPRLIHLIYELMRDTRVPRKRKLGILGGFLYLVFPYDLIPESHFPHLGVADDLIVLLRVMRRLLVDVDKAIVAEHWRGSPDELAFIQKALVKGDDFIVGLGKRLLGEGGKSPAHEKGNV